MPADESAGTPTSEYGVFRPLRKRVLQILGTPSYGEYGPVEGQLYPVAGIYYGDFEIDMGGVWTGFIDQNTFLSIPTDFSTMDQFITWISGKYIAPNVVVYVTIEAGTYTRTSALNLVHACLDRIIFEGQTITDRTLSGIVSSSGSAGNWSIILQLDSISGITTSHYALIKSCSGGTTPKYLEGIHPITNVDSGNNRITINSSHLASSAPSGAVSGTIVILKTVLEFNGCNGIYVGAGKLGLLDNVAVIGNGSGGTYGIVAESGGAAIQLGQNVGVRGFTVGIMAASHAQVTANYCAASGNTYGMYPIHGGTIVAYGAICTGNSQVGANCLGGAMFHGESGTYSGNLTGVQCSLNGTSRILSGSVSGNTTGVYAYGHAYIHAAGTAYANNGTNTSPALNTEGNKGALIDDET